MKFQRCPICDGYGVVPTYYTHSTGVLTNRCPKCDGEMVIKEPEDEQIPESATIKFYKHLMTGFAVAFFGLIIGILVLEYLGLMCR